MTASSSGAGEQAAVGLTASGAEGAALEAARASGRPVRVDALTSETTEVFARPDGQLEARITAGVARVRRGAGWVPLDLRLSRAGDGTVAPGAHPNDLRISGARPAGTHELAAFGRGADRVAMSWTGALSAPVLAGPRATYVDALPGVDLVVEATDVGFSQSLVVKRREAAGAVARVRLTLTGPGVAGFQRDEGGTVILTDKDGGTVVTVPAPAMWDARKGPAGSPVQKLPVRTSVQGRSGGVDLVLEPDAGWLRDVDTVYPVTVDPTVNPLTTTYDTYIRPDSSADLNGESDLWLGYYPTTPATVSRSLLTWDTTVLAGKQINSATFSFYNFWSHTCTPTEWELWRVGPIYSTTRWANQPVWYDADPAVAGDQPAATSTQTKGSTDCADGWVTIDGKSFLQRTAGAGLTRSYMGLKAADETTAAGFKQFRSRENSDSTLDPKAVVTYNSWPTVASRATVPATDCVTGAGRPLVNTLSPQLKATVSDGDGTAMSVEFEWWQVGGAAKLGGQTVTGVASGGTATVTVPAGAFTDGGSFQWRVRANDGVTDSAVWSPFCEMTTYVTAPPVAGCESGTDHDYNGDGVRDLAIADPQATVDGVDKAGQIVVFYGGGTGTAAVLHQGLAEVPGEAGPGGRFGHTLATYDANRDGCSDLAVGVPYASVNGLAEAGGVALLLGSPQGLGKGPAALWYDQATAGFAETAEAGDWFGYALAAGQTSTGEPYLIVGVPGEDIGTGTDAGLVHYRRGSTAVTLYAGAGVGGAAENDDRLGYALAATPTHFAVGAPGETLGDAPNEVSFAGVVETFSHDLVSGKPKPLGTLSQDGYEDAERDDNFGKSLSMVPYRTAASATDSFLVVGVPGEDVGAVADAGMVHRFQLTAAGATHLGALTEPASGVGGGPQDGDYFGERVQAVNTAPAEVSTAQTLQVAVAAPGQDLDGVPDAGMVDVFTNMDGTTPTGIGLARTTGGLPGTATATELLGLAMGASPEYLYVASPYGQPGVYGITWTDLAAGVCTPSVTWAPGAGGIPAGEAAFGAAIG